MPTKFKAGDIVVVKDISPRDLDRFKGVVGEVDTTPVSYSGTSYLVKMVDPRPLSKESPIVSWWAEVK